MRQPNMISKGALCVFAAALTLVSADAALRLPAFITDNMVVQRLDTLKIRIPSEEAVSVTASWMSSGEKVLSVADCGMQLLSIPTPGAGGPYTISFTSGDDTVSLGGIYSGEVWLCSGQSNMEMPVAGWGKVNDYEKEVSEATHSDVHLLQIKKSIAYTPQDDVEVNMGGWQTASPETVGEFSSIAYFFARDLAERLGVHVGVIDSTWGGTPCEAWTSIDGVSAVRGFENETALLRESGFDRDMVVKNGQAQMEKWKKEIDYTPGASDFGTAAPGNVRVAFPCDWDTVLDGFNGIALAKLEVEIPASWEGKEAVVSFGAVDDEDIFYINGREVARGWGYDTRRLYPVAPGLLHPGRNLLTLKITDFEGGGGILGAPELMYMACGDDRISLAGDWACEIKSDFSKAPPKPVNAESSQFPTVLYNAMVHPLRDVPFKGVLWYQGCANVGRDEQYSPLFRRMICDWRTLFNDSELPFHFVQLAGYLKADENQPDSDWAALRRAQADALGLDATAMVVAIDLGEQTDIHPKNKQEVARRLLLTVRDKVYNEKGVVSEAPAPVRCGFGKRGVTVKFNSPITGGVDAKGLLVQEADGSWIIPANVKYGKNSLTIDAPGVRGVKYNYADFPLGRLRGETGLPVAQFEYYKK